MLALAIGVLARVWGPSWTDTIFQGIRVHNTMAVTAFIAAFATGIVLHEAGHLIAAVLLDFEILGGVLGPIRASNVHGTWTFQISGTFFSASVSGIPKQTESWRKRMLIVVAAGPAATLLTALVSGIILFNAHFQNWTHNFLVVSTELNVLLFTLGLMPNASNARVRNDARLFYSLFHSTREAEDILVYHIISQLVIAGVRPRDYPERMIRKMADLRSRPEMSLMYAQTIASWALDKGDLQTAGAWQERALEVSDTCDVRLQNVTLATSAFFDAVFRDDLAGARSKFSYVDLEVISPSYLVHRLKAAYQLAKGSMEEALAEVHRAKFSFPKRLPYYDFERSLLALLHQKTLELAEKQRQTRISEAIAAVDCGFPHW